MKSINAEELCQALKNKGKDNSIFLDVRSNDQYQECHIPGVKNIPLNELPNHISELKSYKTIYVQCGIGVSSAKACTLLEEAGLTNVINVEGGIKSWKKCGLPVNKNTTPKNHS